MLSLEKVQKYIPLFGSGGKKVPEMRTLAGGESIMRPISTRSGRGNVSSKRATLLSSRFDGRASSRAICKEFESLARYIPGYPFLLASSTKTSKYSDHSK